FCNSHGAYPEMPGNKMRPTSLERYAKFDRVGKKAYFTSTLLRRKARAFPLRQPDSGAGWFSPTEMSALVGLGAWRSGWGRRHSFELGAMINSKIQNPEKQIWKLH
ncbi:MAG: hypothetical protein KDK71_09570, partial [Chlamydiia bacterium]|nr:hypothetical protein [Chlamydiia bacterium]